MITLELPFPPSTNRYWRHVGNRVLVSREGRAYRKTVTALLAAGKFPPLTGRLVMYVDVYPPDWRRRDLDNLQKTVWDALADAGIYEDDSQIDKFTVTRRQVVPAGKLLVSVGELTHGELGFNQPSAALHVRRD